MVEAGADVESCDWNGLISWTFGYNSEDFIKDLLILLAQAGNKLNAKTLICCMQDIHDHRGGCREASQRSRSPSVVPQRRSCTRRASWISVD